jgi:hypothetical protein
MKSSQGSSHDRQLHPAGHATDKSSPIELSENLPDESGMLAPHTGSGLARRLAQFGGGAGAAVGGVGAAVGMVAAGVSAGVNVAAPLVNGVASVVPVLLPSLNGLCARGQPVTPLKSRPGLIMCLVGDGSMVTGALLNAVGQLAGAAGSFAGR